LLDATFQDLVANSASFSKDDPRFNPATRKVEYLYHGGQTDKVVYPNRTMFEYLNLAAQGTITDTEAAEHLVIDISFARFSYAEIPKRNYIGILGVTGTLATVKGDGSIGEPILTKEEYAILKKKFKLQTFTYAPSVFGTPKLDFGFAKDVYIHKKIEDWAAAIECDAVKASQKNGAGLIFFKNLKMLRLFLEKRPEMKVWSQLTEATPVSKRDGIVASATQPGTITLCTRSFGRGTNFYSIEDVYVTVIQTFYSSSLSEEVQIKGRAARQGQKGAYMMHLAAPHLDEKFFLQKKDKLLTSPGLDAVWTELETAKANGRIQELLESKRVLKQERKNEGREARYSTSSEADAKSRLLISKLRTTADAQTQLAAIVGACMEQLAAPQLAILTLDCSGSMEGSPWIALVGAFNSYVQALTSNCGASGLPTEVVVIGFADNAGVYAQGPLENFRIALPRARIRDFGGSTNYEAAFECVDAVRAHPRYGGFSTTIVFITDGEPNRNSGHNEFLRKSLRKSAPSGFTCIYFNPSPGMPPAVKELNDIFEQHKVSCDLNQAKNSSELTSQIVAAAKRAPMHRH
jgi:hypothetical protein